MPATQILCPCNHCAKTPLGYDYQSAQLVQKHLKKYGDSRLKSSKATATASTAEDLAVVVGGLAPEALDTDSQNSDSGNEDGPGAGDWFDWFDDAGNEDEYNPTNHLSPPAMPPSPRRSASPVQHEENRNSLPARGDTEFIPAAIGNVYNGLSVKQATDQLNGTLDLHLIAGTLPTFPRPIRTLESAKCRLEIDPDEFITQYTTCPKCWKHHSPAELQELDSPRCLVEECDGILYKETRDSKGRRHWKPFLIIPHTSIIHTLRRFFMCPGFAPSIQDNRNDPEDQNDNPNFVMSDMSDGQGWLDLYTNTAREVGDKGTIHDVPSGGTDRHVKLTSHCYGLHLSWNVDWLRLLENRPHSTGPAYLSINDLKIDQHFLQINVICPSIMPGPKEPSPQQLNHCLEPSIKEMAILKDGVKMDIHGPPERALVYADYICSNCDMPAARKISGQAGHAADLHPCPYCKTTLLDVNKVESYADNSAEHKDDYELL
ncbi:hypothetical protein EDD85DRAFT_956810 [Armillaria nabsnona]|nr:hypothetical protein EDD85DRAFT_956810 [Armillaria nabsnona]